MVFHELLLMGQLIATLNHINKLFSFEAHHYATYTISHRLKEQQSVTVTVWPRQHNPRRAQKIPAACSVRPAVSFCSSQLQQRCESRNRLAAVAPIALPSAFSGKVPSLGRLGLSTVVSDLPSVPPLTLPPLLPLHSCLAALLSPLFVFVFPLPSAESVSHGNLGRCRRGVGREAAMLLGMAPERPKRRVSPVRGRIRRDWQPVRGEGGGVTTDAFFPAPPRNVFEEVITWVSFVDCESERAEPSTFCGLCTRTASIFQYESRFADPPFLFSLVSIPIP